MKRKSRISDRFITSSMNQVWRTVAKLRTENHRGERVAPQLFEDKGIRIGSDDGSLFIDYYGEHRGGYPWIDPRIVKAAEAEGCYWEWQNPGSIVLHQS